MPASSVSNKTVGTIIETDPFYKTGDDKHGYVKANSIAELLGTDVKGVNAVDSGLPSIESDMTWIKLEDGGYNSLTGEFDEDSEKYDYYIAARPTKLQMRLTGAPAYNNGVLAMDTVMNNLYGNLTEIKLEGGGTEKVNVVVARNAKFEDFYEEPATANASSTGYGGVWSTNGSEPNKITATNNRWAPTIFASEDVDQNNGASDGYSDAKITSYNLSTTGVNEQLTADQRNSYSYEKYNEDPGLTAIYNAYWGGANRNTAQASTDTSFWLSSRCVGVSWNSANFDFRCMSGSGLISTAGAFYSGTGIDSGCYALRPVLQVEK